MGFRCSWIAVKGGVRDDVLSQLRLERTGETSEAVYDPGLYGLALPSGWYLVIGDGSDFKDLLQEGQAAALSREGEAMFFFTNDTWMGTSLAAYERGRVAWSINYDGSNGVSEPVLEGAPPKVVNETLAELRAGQAKQGRDVDCLYDLTAEAGRLLIGFRHDQTLSSGELTPIDALSPSPRGG